MAGKRLLGAVVGADLSGRFQGMVGWSVAFVDARGAKFIRAVLIAVGLSLLGLTVISAAQQPDGGVVWDAPMRIPSPEETSSWFPDLVVDREGRVHVVWCETNHLAMNYPQPGEEVDESQFERVYYAVWDGQGWSPANDIVPPQQDIIRNAISVDDYDTLHLLFDFSPPFGLYYKQAQASQAASAAAWTSPRLVNGRRGTYMSDIAVFQNVLHIVYDDRGADKGECPRCADIFYRHSTDRGLTWPAPVSLFPTGTGSSRAQIEIDRGGTIHVAWDEGWDRLSGRGEPQYGVYMYSTDGGNTWSAPTIVSYPDSTNVQLTVGSDGQGGVMLVWRTISSRHPGIYYMWSTDQGENWSPPQALPNIVARRWSGPFDIYDMATDSAGDIHLLVGGHLSAVQEEPPPGGPPHGLYHLKWDGDDWSTPSSVYEGSWYPEYPHLVIDRGNQLHATWYIREDLWEDMTPHQVWYAHGQSQAPAETPVARPMPTLTSESEVATAPTPVSSPTVTPYPELNSDTPPLPGGLYTEDDELLQLAVALLPVSLLILVIIAVRLGWFKNLINR